MSAARAGQWDLLGYDSDPVPADGSELTGLISHYTKIADAMTAQAALLKKIGEGDENLLKGESADAIRERAGETHENLGKAGARYEDVRDALDTYQPELQAARSETRKALTAAEKAAGDKKSAEGLPDPANEDRSDDNPLSGDDKQASRNRSDKIGTAEGDLEAARAMAANAMAALDAAADAAASKIKENWGDDGLHHSWQDAAYHGFMKFLKGFVEVLGWIGMALAVVAMIIPGLGVLAWVALGVAVFGLVCSITLAGLGEASWMGVVWGAVGVLTAVGGLGAAKLIANATKAAKGAAADGVATKLFDMNKIAKALAFWKKKGAVPPGTFGRTFALDRVNSANIKLIEALKSVKGLEAAVKINPAAWKVWNWAAAVGLGGTKELKAINVALQDLKISMPQVILKPWVYVMGSGSWFAGFVSGAWSTGVPASAFADDARPGSHYGNDARDDYDGTATFEDEHMTTPYRGQSGLG